MCWVCWEDVVLIFSTRIHTCSLSGKVLKTKKPRELKGGCERTTVEKEVAGQQLVQIAAVCKD